MCNDKRGLEINLHDIGRSHIIGKVKDVKSQVIVRFISYRTRTKVHSNKKGLEKPPRKHFHHCNPYQYRTELVKQLADLKYNGLLYTSILSDKFISICNINIRRIRNKINFLQNFVDEFDIIVLTETHLDNSIENRDIELDSFIKNPQRKNRTNSGGALLIYSKEDIGICRKHQLENDIDETIWVEVHAKVHSFIVCNTNRSEWTDSEYWARLNYAIGLAYQVNENIVISGDLNSDLISLNHNKLIDTMRLFILKNVIEKPTRVTNHSKTLLDPIIVSETINYVFSDVVHYRIVLVIMMLQS